MAARLGISREDVHEAVVKIWREGDKRITVAAVAKELGCAPPSIYHHLPNGLDDVEAIVRVQTRIDGYVWCERMDSPHEWPVYSKNGSKVDCEGTHWTIAKNEVITNAP